MAGIAGLSRPVMPTSPPTWRADRKPGTVNDAGTPDRGDAVRTSIPADRDPALLAARHLARSGWPAGESAPLRMYATTPG